MYSDQLFEEVTRRVNRELGRIADQNPHLGKPDVSYSPQHYDTEECQAKLNLHLEGCPEVLLLGIAERLMERMSGLSDHRIKISSKDRYLMTTMRGSVIVTLWAQGLE